MKTTARVLSFALLLAFACFAQAAEAPDKWTPAECLKYRLVTDAQVSPDGK